jgi:hypothetical protein
LRFFFFFWRQVDLKKAILVIYQAFLGGGDGA